LYFLKPKSKIDKYHLYELKILGNWGLALIKYLIIFIAIFSLIFVSVPNSVIATHEGGHEHGVPYSVQDPVYPNPDWDDVLICPQRNDDNLCTKWEKSQGLWIYYNGKSYKYLCGQYGPDDQCPDKNEPDVYVEIDWFKGHSPDNSAINDVSDAFLDKGIQLHIQKDEVVKSDGSNFDDEFLSVPISTATGNTEFDVIKEDWFGEKYYRERQGIESPTNMVNDWLTYKKQAFHYALFIHKQEAEPDKTGTAEFEGNDMIISLGSFPNPRGTDDQQSGTFMHELGHNLGLQHGGEVDDLNCKPNNLSVMNYVYQFSVPVQRDLLYSDPTDMIDLDEASLSEQDGIGCGAQGKNIVWSDGASTFAATVPPPDANGNCPIDWDQDSDDTEVVPMVIHDIAGYDCDSTETTLMVADDWNNIKYDFTIHTHFLDGRGSQMELIDTEAPLTAPPTFRAATEGKWAENELTKTQVANMLVSRISTITDVIPKVEQQNYSQEALNVKAQQFDLEGLLEDLKALPSNKNIDILKEALEISTQMKAIPPEDPDEISKYFYDSGKFAGPRKQVSNGIALTDEICKNELYMIRLDKDKNLQTDTVAACITAKSVIPFLKRTESILYSDIGVCDLVFPNEQLDKDLGNIDIGKTAFDENKGFFDNLIDVNTGKNLDCQSYFDSFK